MTNYVLVLFSAAITVVFTRGSLFNPLRTRGLCGRSGPLSWAWELWCDLAECPLCSGVWVGGLAYLGSGDFCVPYAGVWPWISLLFAVLGVGSLTGCLALFSSLVLDYLDTAAAILELEWDDRKEQRRARDSVREAVAARGKKAP